MYYNNALYVMMMMLLDFEKAAGVNGNCSLFKIQRMMIATQRMMISKNNICVHAIIWQVHK